MTSSVLPSPGKKRGGGPPFKVALGTLLPLTWRTLPDERAGTGLFVLPFRRTCCWCCGFSRPSGRYPAVYRLTGTGALQGADHKG